MNIKRMRLVLPARMRSSAQVDARLIAEAAGRALHGHDGLKGTVRVEVRGQGGPARFVARDVFNETSRQARVLKSGGD